MNSAEEFLIIIGITIFFIVGSKLLNNIKIKEKTIKIPKVISVIFLGFIVGLIIRSIDSTFQFKLTPYLSFISLEILFVSFGSMIDFKALKKFGVSALLLGTIPYLIEFIGITILITFLTKLYWFEAGIASVLICMCSPGVVGGKLVENLMKGYETKSNLNQTTLLASSIENIMGLIIFLILIVFYLSGWNDDGTGIKTISGKTIALSIFVFTPLLLIFGAILGGSRFIINPYKISIEGLKDSELKKATLINEKARTKSNALIWISTAIVFAGLYLLIRLTIGIGFIMMESGLITGITLSLAGSKSLENENIKQSITKNSSIFYAAIGSMLVWGFGGILIDPSSIFSSGWSSISGAGSIPNVVWIIIFIVGALILRTIGIFIAMSINSSFTTKQKLYTIIPFFSKGTGGVNNAVSIAVVLGVSIVSGNLQSDHVLILQQILISTGTILVFVTIPIGILLLSYFRDKLIFIWEEETEGNYKRKIKSFIKEEKELNSENKKELNNSIKEYWNFYYKKQSYHTKATSLVDKPNNKINNKINYLLNKIKNSEVKKEEYSFENEKYIKSQNRELQYKKTVLISKQKNEKAKLFEEKINSKIEKSKDVLKEKISKKNNLLIELNETVTTLKKQLKEKINLETSDLVEVKEYRENLKEYNRTLNSVNDLLLKNIKNKNNLNSVLIK